MAKILPENKDFELFGQTCPIRALACQVNKIGLQDTYGIEFGRCTEHENKLTNGDEYRVK